MKIVFSSYFTKLKYSLFQKKMGNYILMICHDCHPEFFFYFFNWFVRRACILISKLVFQFSGGGRERKIKFITAFSLGCCSHNEHKLLSFIILWCNHIKSFPILIPIRYCLLVLDYNDKWQNLLHDFNHYITLKGLSPYNAHQYFLLELSHAESCS